MTITNHILTGAIIGLVVSNPVAAIVLAFASHFVLDALPHFGYAGRKGYAEALRHKLSYGVAIATAITTAAILVFLALHGEWFAIFTGLIAASPDAVGVYNWLGYEKHNKPQPTWLKLTHVKFHRAIQRCERPWGVIVEIAVFVALCLMLNDLV